MILMARCQPIVGWYARRMRLAKSRFTINAISTPAATNIAAAIARLMSVGRHRLAMRSVHVTIRDMEKPGAMLARNARSRRWNEAYQTKQR
jgi:hypothetical protein